ncbi:MAG: hypothetical protein SPL08_02560 [Pseudomonadota bacterium]|nr:hypothetical protein [Pseudomonadota bacterium]
MKNLVKWLTRLIAISVLVFLIASSALCFSTYISPFSYYFEKSFFDGIIFSGMILLFIISCVIALLWSFQKVKGRTVLFLWSFSIGLLLFIYNQTALIAVSHFDDGVIPALTKKGCFVNADCATQEEINNASKDTNITKVGCSPGEKEKFHTDQNWTPFCISDVSLEWKCTNEGCQCMLTRGPAECYY